MTAATGSCGSCASSPWPPSPCAVRLRRPTKGLGASRNERYRSPLSSGTRSQSWSERRTWTETPFVPPTSTKSSGNSRRRADSHAALLAGRRMQGAREHAIVGHSRYRLALAGLVGQEPQVRGQPSHHGCHDYQISLHGPTTCWIIPTYPAHGLQGRKLACLQEALLVRMVLDASRVEATEYERPARVLLHPRYSILRETVD